MIRLRAVCAAVLSGLAIVPAGAADRLLSSQPYIGAPARVVTVAAPFYVVNQGPEISGPGIMITEIGITRTDMRWSYPFIGMADDLTRVMVPAGYHGADPVLEVRAQARAPQARPSAWRHKPAKARRAR